MHTHTKTLVLTLAGLTVFSQTIQPVAAATSTTAKEEVVYVSLQSDGSTKEVNVVNIVQPDANGEITDYGSYETVRNMTTTDTINSNGDTQTIKTSAEKLYYEGTLANAQIPWNIQISYTLDGSPVSTDELAGKSGALAIHIRISENTSANGTFYDDFALQASLSLDTDLCENISSNDATIANVGSNKQLSFTVLPGKGLDTEITADVHDFKMDAISINAIPLHLSVDVDDEKDELLDKVDELTDALEELNDGAGEIHDGTKSASDGQSTLSDGAKSLSDGSTSLDNGMQTLQTGIEQVQAGLDALNAQSATLTDGSAQMKTALTQLQTALQSVSASADDLEKLTAASSSIKQGISALQSGASALETAVSVEAYKTTLKSNGLDTDTLKDKNAEAVSSLQSMLGQVSTIEATLEQLGISSDAIAPYEKQCTDLAKELIQLLNGNTAALNATEAYLSSVHTEAGKLTDGLSELSDNYASMDAAIQTLTKTLTQTLYDMSTLKDAVNQLVVEYSKLDDGVTAYTDGVAQVVSGYSQIADGTTTLVKGSSALADGSNSLYSGTKALADGLFTLYEATGTLSDGTTELVDKTADMDDEIQDQIDDLLDSISGGDTEITSFVSSKNTDVHSVQFVMNTEAIELPDETEAVAVEQEETGFLQKLVNLFKH